MQASDLAVEALKELEGFSGEVYDDGAGNLTIGFGHMLSEREKRSGHLNIGHWNWHAGITQSQASLLLELDKDAAEDAVNDLVRVELTQGQYDALVLFVFNIGRGAFAESTLLRLLNDSKYLAVSAEFAKWVHSGGQVSRGLVHRRMIEKGFFNEKD